MGGNLKSPSGVKGNAAKFVFFVALARMLQDSDPKVFLETFCPEVDQKKISVRKFAHEMHEAFRIMLGEMIRRDQFISIILEKKFVNLFSMLEQDKWFPIEYLGLKYGGKVIDTYGPIDIFFRAGILEKDDRDINVPMVRPGPLYHDLKRFFEVAEAELSSRNARKLRELAKTRPYIRKGKKP